MWLVTININSTDYQVSTEDLALESFWDGDVLSLNPISWMPDHNTGGYIRPRFGSIDLSAALFQRAGVWPPQESCAITFELTDDNEAGKILILEATAHCKSYDRTKISYSIYADSYDSYLNGTIFTADTISSIFTTYCGASYLNLTLDTTYIGAGGTQTITYTVPSKDTLLIDVLSAIAASANLFFFIKDGTLYLWNMRTTCGTSNLTEFDFLPATYEPAPPISYIVSGAYSVVGAYSYGQEISTLSADYGVSYITAHMANSRDDILERPRARIEIPALVANIPNFGEVISWTDENVGPDSASVAMKVRELSFTQNGDFIKLEGDSAIT